LSELCFQIVNPLSVQQSGPVLLALQNTPGADPCVLPACSSGCNWPSHPLSRSWQMLLQTHVDWLQRKVKTVRKWKKSRGGNMRLLLTDYPKQTLQRPWKGIRDISDFRPWILARFTEKFTGSQA